jgi:rubrerythrin
VKKEDMQQGILRDFERKVTKGDRRAFNIEDEQLLENIYDVTPIEQPREAFKHFITSEASHATRT